MPKHVYALSAARPAVRPRWRQLLGLLALAGLTGLGACQREAAPGAATAQPSATRGSEARPITAAEAEIKAKIPEQMDQGNHAWVMDAILGKARTPIRTVGILVYDGVNDLDFTGPRYVLGQVGAKTQLVGIKPGPIKTVMGVQVVPDTTIDEVTQLDIVVIPGGFTGTVEAAYDPKVLAWIRQIDKTSVYTASVCSGGWILGATGLLEGRRASTNWFREDEFLAKYKAIPTHQRWTQDGKYWTAAGVTAGMDMALAIVNDNWGERYTQGIMLDMEYDPAPPIPGGSPEKTGWLVHWMMKTMYGAGLDPLFEKFEAQRR
jgi:putative intracellular protease/amidase